MMSTRIAPSRSGATSMNKNTIVAKVISGIGGVEGNLIEVLGIPM